MTYEVQISNIIKRLKQVRQIHPEFTLQKVSDETGISLSTVSRIFADGSETLEHQSFRYDSIKPIAALLLEDDSLEDNEEKALLKAIIAMHEAEIARLEHQNCTISEKFEKKLEKERAHSRVSIDFLKHQIELKDDRITKLLDAYQELHVQYLEATNKLLASK